MPTKRRRHAITETPPVQAALDELRGELGDDGVELGELVVLGVGVKLAMIRSERDGDAAKRGRLADRVRAIEGQRQLARAGHHRLPPVNLIIAALADTYGLGILHYDNDYEIVSEKTDLSFDSIWLAPRGSI
jgi:hypothetical protein